MRIRVTAVTHLGLERDGNEDSVGVHGWSLRGPRPAALSVDIEVREPVTVVVCDGMGGHAGGAEASRLACEIISEPGILTADADIDGLTAELRERLQFAADTVNDAAAADRALTGMGCTAAGVTVLPDGRAVVFNLGDSRGYRLEGRYLAQLTVDHRHSGTNRLEQAIGGGVRMILEPDFFDCVLPAAPGIVLCSDGLDDYAEAAAIEAAVAEGGADLPTRLRDLALRGGGGDNVTVVAVAELPDEPDSAEGR